MTTKFGRLKRPGGPGGMVTVSMLMIPAPPVSTLVRQWLGEQGGSRRVGEWEPEDECARAGRGELDGHDVGVGDRDGDVPGRGRDSLTDGADVSAHRTVGSSRWSRRQTVDEIARADATVMVARVDLIRTDAASRAARGEPSSST
jgi:hypothetical protein